MKKLKLSLMCTCVLAVFGATAQTTIQFEIDQPAEPLMVDAGMDQVYDGVASIVLGGGPTATGGNGNYTYSWTPAEFLDDPTVPNPTVINLVGPSVFTVLVTADGALCEKSEEVFVDYSVSIFDVVGVDFQLFPNPFSDRVQFKSELGISAIRVFDITGKILIDAGLGKVDFGSLATNELTQGMYLFQIEFISGQIKTVKLCKSL